MDIQTILILGHIIGTILGVGGATFIELHLNMALQDGKMDAVEKQLMSKDFLLTRIGMVITFLSGFGFVLQYYFHNQLFRLYDGVFWAKMIIILVIIINAYLLHKHKIGLYWGSAFSFVSWWVVVILGVFRTNNVKFFSENVPLSIVSILVVYAIAIVIGASILHKLRTPKQTMPTPTA